MILRSPVTGRVLTRAGHSLSAAGERWPVVDDIAFLRADRRALAGEVLACLDSGDATGALVTLLGDQDGWARTPPPTDEARREVIAGRDTLSFRAAMDLLAFGPVGTYFAHRWTDPTFLSGLALAQSYWGAPRSVLELACGAGHFLRAFAGHATEVIGGDLVFAKLWLARHWIAPLATLVCFDAASPWPFAHRAADLLFCHDAFYFLPEKRDVAAEMLRVGTRILVGHMHNALVDNLSAGEPMEPATYAAMFPAPDMFDDRELTAALVAGRVPRISTLHDLATAPAIALAVGTAAPGLATGPLTDPTPGTALRRNPLYQGGEIAWPSERYATEYGPLATYPSHSHAAEHAVAGSVAVDSLARQRVFVDLPERW
ncbi:class I SAM-dependent methyltransferase [Acidisphaera sp. L21]|uniref:class I SAM-dependent methyltransferase n=1 Tax=Acidisphaera sp. L21 TaxID=1641851 RepID=UPI00131B343A|nr:class I SAM-dependent methyltransferase [Acidisphaera sp. L21]